MNTSPEMKTSPEKYSQEWWDANDITSKPKAKKAKNSRPNKKRKYSKKSKKMDHNGSEEEGNTSSSSDRIAMGRYWCFTFNNYTKEDMDQIQENFKSINAKYLFCQEICPTTGTPHLQGFAQFAKKLRPLETKIFSKRISWKRCKGGDMANIVYCTKTKVKVWGNIRYNKPLKLITPGSGGRKWQLDIIEWIQEEADERTIHWVYEEVGGVGKTAFIKYLTAEHEALKVSGRGTDIIHMIAKRNETRGCYPDILCYDVPRHNQRYVNYGIIENIKSGHIMSGKYEGAEILMNSPHIIIFANEPPQVETMSKDRWKIYKIVEENNEQVLQPISWREV